jgi:carboxymethylenebutenolidase
MSGIRTWTTTCGDMPAVVAVPEADAKAPCVIVMHERYGFVAHTCALAERFARDGFVAIAPNFYFKHPDQDALHRGDAGYAMSDREAVAGLDAAIEALHVIPHADAARLAVMGVCQTARHPLVLAASRRIAAALVWYGAAQPREWKVNDKYMRPLADIIAATDCPVLGMFGETDHLISIEDVRRFRDCLERHGKAYAIHIWRDAPHGWLNDTMPGRYRRAQAEAAWAEQRVFLREVLAPEFDHSRRVQRYAADVAADYDFNRNVRME